MREGLDAPRIQVMNAVLLGLVCVDDVQAKLIVGGNGSEHPGGDALMQRFGDAVLTGVTMVLGDLSIGSASFEATVSLP